ncbi:MAG TPA: cupin domain-containing protein [Acidimicrobiia bacterium]|jgi:quercetin dioxygenase-like cupin family protein|nr:cupin domain-containing protein [Acidimicrobiia bacterium]
MNVLETGLDDTGRTCVLKSTNLEPPGDAMNGESVFRLAELPPAIPAQSTNGFVPAGSWTNEMPPRPGEVTWMTVQFPANGSFDRHQTPTVDFDSILGGSLELILDDGVHILQAGDCVIINGIDHAWRAGPDGCTMAVLMLGAVNRA